jgi:hypothetical protein
MNGRGSLTRRLTLLCLASGLLGPDARAVPAPTADQARECRVPIALVHHKTLVPVRFEGLRDLHLILDSGMGFDGLLLFKPDLKDSLDIRKPIEAAIPGAGGGPPSAAILADSMSFRVGGVRFENQRIIILSGNTMGSAAVDGVIGYSLLGHYAVAVDFDSLTLTLHDPRTFEPASGWTSLPLRFGRNNLPFIETSIVVEHEAPIPLNTYIDCASSETIELLLRPGMKFTIPKAAVDACLGRGLSGDINGKRGAIARLILGPHELKDVVAAFAPAEIRSKAEGADAVLANGALCRFNLVFDYARARLLVKPNRHFGDRFE